MDDYVLATVLNPSKTPEGDSARRWVVIPTGPVSFDKLGISLAGLVTAIQLEQIYAGFVALRSAFSSELTPALELRSIDRGRLAFTDAYSDEALERLESGGALISLVAKLNTHTGAQAGRPGLSTTQMAFRDALGMAVARIAELGEKARIAERNEALYTSVQTRIARALEWLEAPLFNLNNSHRTPEIPWPALAWCEREGPGILARRYGLDAAELSAQMHTAFSERIKQRGAEAAIAEEVKLLEAISDWARAYQQRREAERARSDTVNRALKRHNRAAAANAHVDVAGAGMAQPPRMHTGVRIELIAQNRLATLSPEMLIKLAALFELAPAHDVLMTRQYLSPLILLASLAGTLRLRRQDGRIDQRWLGGAAIALSETAGYEFGLAHTRPRLDDNVKALLDNIDDLFRGAGPPIAELSSLGRRFLATNKPQKVTVRPGPIGFFVD
jgi:hypothetical protein